MNKIDLSDKVAVVTGGAQGFGYAIANRFIKSCLLYTSDAADE